MASTQTFLDKNAPLLNVNSRENLAQLAKHLESATLYHWTEANQAPELVTQGFSDYGVYLTASGDDPVFSWNPDIIWLYRPTRLTIDSSQLDLTLLRYDPYSGEGYVDWDEEKRTAVQSLELTGNVYYAGPIPASAVLASQEFAPPRSWKMTNANPEDYGYEA